jgi:hypothetical protein
MTAARGFCNNPQPQKFRFPIDGKLRQICGDVAVLLAPGVFGDDGLNGC